MYHAAVVSPMPPALAAPATRRVHKEWHSGVQVVHNLHVPCFYVAGAILVYIDGRCRQRRTQDTSSPTNNTNIDHMQVSYILYLVDKDWGSGEKPDGGGLQLYPLENEEVPGIPAYAPSKTIPPRWNQMVLFAVQPGRSFHDVQEVRWEGAAGGIGGGAVCWVGCAHHEAFFLEDVPTLEHACLTIRIRFF